MNDSERAKLLERVRKLLALAGNNANENEAAAAAEKAQALLVEHNLSMLDIDNLADDETKDIGVDNSIITSSNPWRRPLAVQVAKLYFCEYFYSSTRGSKNIHSFVGKKHNIEVAKMMFMYLLEAIDRLAREGAKGLPIKEQSPYRVAFRGACTKRLCQRIMERIEAAKRGEIKSETTGSNLPALASMYDRSQNALTKYIEKNVGGMRMKRTSLSTHLHSKGASDGYAAGNRIGLDQQVGGRSQHKALR
jgi:hypothetical protein